jgi:hypothetical protein
MIAGNMDDGNIDRFKVLKISNKLGVSNELAEDVVRLQMHGYEKFYNMLNFSITEKKDRLDYLEGLVMLNAELSGRFDVNLRNEINSLDNIARLKKAGGVCADEGKKMAYGLADNIILYLMGVFP